ncbi:MAG TPA: FxSxx-COOH system tetratricopeptide repeat protein [Ktedonobacteraceae bacterium]|nr:FxSxx-COOH system tetratricopeptide repeat protein [Ktedonobacteraceae bacterium]
MVKKAAHATPNHLLRAARKERGWTQQQVADYIGAPLALNVSRWENGTAFPSAYYLQRLCQLFGKSVRELGLSQLEEEIQSQQVPQIEPALEQKHAFAEIRTDRQDHVHPQTTSRIGMLPFPRNPFFVGRDDLLTRLRQQFLAGQTRGRSQPLAISGLGGVGKTQLAFEYAYRHADDYQALFWTRADSRDTLVTGFLEIASTLRLPEREERDQRIVVAAVKNWLNRHAGWLLIMDNADEPTLLPEFLPSSLAGHLLLTTRARALGGLADRIELETLDVDTGPLLLLRRAGLLALDAPLAQAKPIDWQAAVQLSQEMGGLPLALDQAAAYLEETGCSPQQYLELYRNHGVNLLRSRGGVVLDHPDSITTSWSLSFALIEQRSTLAADLLRMCALLHPDAIPEELFLKAATHMGPALAAIEANPLAFNQALAIVQNYSLVRRNGHEQMLSMHRLVQAVLLDAMTGKEREQWRERAIAALNAVFPEMIFQGWEHWEVCSRLLPHVLTIATNATDQQQELASLLTKAADYLCQRAQYEQARPLYQRALSIYEQTLGRDHPQTAFPLYGLAGLALQQTDHRQAELLFQRALTIWEQAPTQYSRQIAALLNDLAILYAQRGQFERAEPLFQRALLLDERPPANSYGKVATHLNNLAILYCQQRQFERAEPLLQRALLLDEQEFGPEHPEVSYSLVNLAECYQDQGRFTEAEPLLRRALSIREQTLGRDHPQTAFPLNILANLYRNQGRFEEAESFYRRALAIRRQQRGDQHLETAISLADFARLHELRDQPEQALALYQQVLSIREHLLGSEHPETRETRESCARLFIACGQPEKAAALKTASNS